MYGNYWSNWYYDNNDIDQNSGTSNSNLSYSNDPHNRDQNSTEQYYQDPYYNQNQVRYSGDANTYQNQNLNLVNSDDVYNGQHLQNRRTQNFRTSQVHQNPEDQHFLYNGSNPNIRTSDNAHQNRVLDPNSVSLDPDSGLTTPHHNEIPRNYDYVTYNDDEVRFLGVHRRVKYESDSEERETPAKDSQKIQKSQGLLKVQESSKPPIIDLGESDIDSDSVGYSNKIQKSEELSGRQKSYSTHDFPEYIDTKQLGIDISAELKAHNISQTRFAKKIINRTQGTLSDLLMKPKKWENMKMCGQSSYVKMWKWLQQPLERRLDVLSKVEEENGTPKRRLDNPKDSQQIQKSQRLAGIHEPSEVQISDLGESDIDLDSEGDDVYSSKIQKSDGYSKLQTSFSGSPDAYITIDSSSDDSDSEGDDVYSSQKSGKSSRMRKSSDLDSGASSSDIPKYIDTKQLGIDITAELKAHNISQTRFAKKIINRTQGTLSDLLMKPKKWENMKMCGQSSYVKMWKWLQQPLEKRLEVLNKVEEANGAHLISRKDSQKIQQSQRPADIQEPSKPQISDSGESDVDFDSEGYSNKTQKSEELSRSQKSYSGATDAYITIDSSSDDSDSEGDDVYSSQKSEESLRISKPSNSDSGASSSDIPEYIDTKQLGIDITAELKAHNISQTLFAKKIINRAQGTLSELLMKPKKWENMKMFGRSTYVKLWQWLQQPLERRLAVLSEVDETNGAQKRRISTASSAPAPKKLRLIFTEVQKKTLDNIFNEEQKPSKELMETISGFLELEYSTVFNFFMNARKRDRHAK